MEMICNGQAIEISQGASADEIIEKINEVLEKGHYFSHFVADGEEVYEEHERYLEQRAGKIKKLEVIAKQEKEFVNDLLLAGDEYIKRALPELSILAEEFSENPDAGTWAKLNDLLGGLQWLDEMLMAIGRSGTVPANWQGYLNISAKMQEEIKELAEAMENEDNVLIGDIIQYELQPVFETFAEEINVTIDNEGTRHDLS